MIDAKKCQEMLDLWIAAEAEISVAGQSYAIGGRQLTRANLSEVNKQIEVWSGRLAKAKGASGVIFSTATIRG